MKRWISPVVATCLVCLTFSPSLAQLTAAEFAALAKYLPDDANAVVVVNAAALYASPLAQSENWKQKYADRFEASPLMLPPSAEGAVLGAEISLQTLKPQWEAGAMRLSIDPSPADIARARGGRNDVLDGMVVTWLGRDMCIFKFAPHTFGVIVPATRQSASRWAADINAGGSGELSRYLAQSISFADTAGTHLILAVDLSNTFTEANLKAMAAASDELKGISPDQAATILASVQGVKFGVKATDRLVGRVQLDFSENTGPLAAVAKGLILKVIAKAGATLPEFASWTPEVGPTSLALTGDLTADGFRRVFSLLELDAGALESAEPAADVATTTTVSADAAKQAMLKSTLRYFRGVGKYIDDISRLQRASSLDQAVVWIENYARKVESLPTKNVDPELVQYGQYVANTFRSIVDEASGLAQQVSQSEQPVVTNYRIGYLPTARTVNYGGNFQRMYAPYGYADYDPQAQQKNIQQTQQQVSTSLAQATKTLTQLVADQKTVGQKLSTKYGVPF